MSFLIRVLYPGGHGLDPVVIRQIRVVVEVGRKKDVTSERHSDQNSLTRLWAK